MLRRRRGEAGRQLQVIQENRTQADRPEGLTQQLLTHSVCMHGCVCVFLSFSVYPVTLNKSKLYKETSKLVVQFVQILPRFFSPVSSMRKYEVWISGASFQTGLQQNIHSINFSPQFCCRTFTCYWHCHGEDRDSAVVKSYDTKPLVYST